MIIPQVLVETPIGGTTVVRCRQQGIAVEIPEDDGDDGHEEAFVS